MRVRLITVNGRHTLFIRACDVEEAFPLRQSLPRVIADNIANDQRLVRTLAPWAKNPQSLDLLAVAAAAVMELTLVVSQEHHGVEPVLSDEQLP